MPNYPDWHFGMVLQNGHTGEIALFLRLDRDRTRMLGGGAVQWIGMRLQRGRYAPKSLTAGAVGNYSFPNWKLVEDLIDHIAVPMPSIFEHARGSGWGIIDPAVTITGTTTTVAPDGTITTTVAYEEK